MGTQVPGQALGEMALAYGKGHCCWVRGRGANYKDRWDRTTLRNGNHRGRAHCRFPASWSDGGDTVRDAGHMPHRGQMQGIWFHSH